ncbi:MAG: TolC family protein, partial [Planctomycetota bacterium]
IATLDYESRLAELILEAKKVFNNVLLAQSELFLSRERFDIDNKSLDIIRKSYTAGRLTQSEFLNTEQKVAGAKIALQGKEEALKNELHNLRRLLGVDESTPLECPAKLEPLFYEVKSDRIKETMLVNHPRIKLRRSAIKLTEAQLVEDRAGRIPDLRVGLDYMEPIQSGHSMVGLSVELPLPLFNRNQGKIAQTRSELIAAQEQLQSVENDLITSFNQALNNYQLAADNVMLYESKIMPNEEKQYKIADVSYKSGRVSYQELLSARMKLIDITLAYLGFIKMLNDASAELEYLAGKPQ